MSTKFLSMAGILGFLGVALGAFGAHGLEDRLTETGFTDVWQTATIYLFFHVLALLTLSQRIFEKSPDTLLIWSGWLWISGMILFSGSLYVLAITGISRLGMVTPLGGILFLAGWVCLVIVGIRGAPRSRDPSP